MLPLLVLPQLALPLLALPLLVLPLLALSVRESTAVDNDKETTYTLKSAESCPETGYYFENDSVTAELKPGVCHLCFCRDKGDAVCWERPSAECITKRHRNIDRLDSRIRRSPLTNVALKYLAKSVSSKQRTYNCMPLGSTLSEGCPPDDWCLGCTICDCEASGHWNCHVLSFCSDRKATKRIQSYSGNLKRRAVRIHPKLDGRADSTGARGYAGQLGANPKRGELTLTKRHQRLPEREDNAVVYEKDLVGRKSTEIRGVRVKKILNGGNGRARLAQKVQRAIAAVHKVIGISERSAADSAKSVKVIKKRSMPRREASPSSASDPRGARMRKISNPRRLREWATAAAHENRRTRRSVMKRGNTTLLEQSTSELHDEYANETLVDGPRKTPTDPLKLNDHEYYKYNVVTDEKPDADDDTLKVKHLTYNFYYGNKSISVHETVSHNLTDAKLYSASDVLNLSMSHHVKDKKHNIKSINITDVVKYFTAAPDMNSSVGDNDRKVQKNGAEMRPLPRAAEGGGARDESAETEDLNLINNMLGSEGVLRRVTKKQPKAVLRNENSTDNLSFIMNLKKLFNKMFATRKNGRDKLKVLDEQNLLDTFCSKNVSCVVRPRDRIKLHIKINELNGETYKIIETIKIIKKLLQAIVKNDSEADTAVLKASLGNDIKTIFSHESYCNVTESRQLQLYYIREGIKTFIKSIGKFSYILQDILHMFTDHEDVRRSPRRPLRCARTNGLNKTGSKTLTPEQRFKKLRIALMNYNLLQNTFIKRIYDMLTKLETNLTDADKKKRIKKPETAEAKGTNKSFAVEKYTRNIIDNLRKLKNLALKLGSAARRRKRSAMGDDDAVEYLLTLMEYLLKQNYPLDASPVNDGIDLLIDAIKHAPDIKPIKKKVLDVATAEAIVTRTSPSPTTEAAAYLKDLHEVAAAGRDNSDRSRSDDNPISPTSRPTEDGSAKIEDFHRLLHNSKKFRNSFRLSNLNSILKSAKSKPVVTTTLPTVTTSPLVQYDFYKYNSHDTGDTDKYIRLGYTVAADDKNELEESLRSYADGRDRQAEVDDYPPGLGRAGPRPGGSVPTRTSPARGATTRKFHHMVRHKLTTDASLYDSKYSKTKFNWADYGRREEGGRKTERKTVSQPKEHLTALRDELLRTFDGNEVSDVSRELENYGAKVRTDESTTEVLFNNPSTLGSTELGERKPDADSEPDDTYVSDVFAAYM